MADSLILTVGSEKWVLSHVGENRYVVAEGYVEGGGGADEVSLVAIERAVKGIPLEELEGCGTVGFRLPSKKMVGYINTFNEWDRRSERVREVQSRLAVALDTLPMRVSASFYPLARSRERYLRDVKGVDVRVEKRDDEGVVEIVQELEG